MSNSKAFPFSSFTLNNVEVTDVLVANRYVDQMPAAHLSQRILILRGGDIGGGAIAGHMSSCLDLMDLGKIAALSCVICIPITTFICTMVMTKNWEHDKEQKDEAGTISITTTTPVTHTTKQLHRATQGLSSMMKTFDMTEQWIRRITFPFRIFVYVHIFHIVMEMSHTMEEWSEGFEHTIEGVKCGIERHSKAIEELNHSIGSRLKGVIKGRERVVRNTTNDSNVKPRFLHRTRGNE